MTVDANIVMDNLSTSGNMTMTKALPDDSPVATTADCSTRDRCGFIAKDDILHPLILLHNTSSNRELSSITRRIICVIRVSTHNIFSSAR